MDQTGCPTGTASSSKLRSGKPLRAGSHLSRAGHPLFVPARVRARGLECGEGGPCLSAARCPRGSDGSGLLPCVRSYLDCGDWARHRPLMLPERKTVRQRRNTCLTADADDPPRGVQSARAQDVFAQAGALGGADPPRAQQIRDPQARRSRPQVRPLLVSRTNGSVWIGD
jgi:hypothetical protein